MSHGGRQEPARGARRRRGVGRPDPLLLRPDGAATTASPARWASCPASEHTRSVMRPYGVWAVISPFNFPMALAAGPTGGALVAGNTVVLKPSPQGSFTGDKLYECLRDAGLPAGVFHVLPGGDEIGKAVVAHPERRRPHLHRLATRSACRSTGTSPRAYPKPVVCEMGGKNPAIVSAKADLDTAARASPARPSASPGRSARPARASTSSATVLRAVRSAARRARRPARGRRPHRARRLHRPGDRRRGRRAASRTPSRTPARRAASLAGGEVLGKTTAGAAGHYVAPTVVDRPARPTTSCSATSCSCRSWPWPRSTRSTRRSTLANDTDSA